MGLVISAEQLYLDLHWIYLKNSGIEYRVQIMRHGYRYVYVHLNLSEESPQKKESHRTIRVEVDCSRQV